MKVFKNASIQFVLLSLCLGLFAMILFSLEGKAPTHFDNVRIAFDSMLRWYVLAPSLMISLGTVLPSKWKFDGIVYWTIVALVAGMTVLYIVSSFRHGRLASEEITPIRYASFSLTAVGFSSQISKMKTRPRFYVLWGAIPILTILLFLPSLVGKA